MNAFPAPNRAPLADIGLCDIPPELALLSLPGALLLPQGAITVPIRDHEGIGMIDDALAGSRLIGVMPYFPLPDSPPWLKPTRQVGTVARIMQIKESPTGEYEATLAGICRFLLIREVTHGGWPKGRVDVTPYCADLTEPHVGRLDRDDLGRALRRYFRSNNLTANWRVLDKLKDEILLTVLPMALPLDVGDKQALLQAPSLEERASRLLDILHQADA